MGTNRATQKILLYDRELGYRNWNAEVEQIFNFINQTGLYDSLSACNLTYFSYLLIDKMKNDW
jgi:hypothetical protein